MRRPPARGPARVAAWLIAGALAVALPLDARLSQAEPAPGASTLRAEVQRTLAAGDVPGAIGAYFRLRAQTERHEPQLLEALAWSYLSTAVAHGGQWSPGERRAALDALGRSGRAAAVPLLASLQKEADWQLRWAALEALEPLPDPAAAEALATALGDRDRRVRCVAGTLLLQRGVPLGARAALECGSPAALQYRALRVLLRHAKQLPADALGAVAQHAAQDPRVLLAAVIARRQRPSERPVLARLELDTKPMVKRAARGARAMLEHPDDPRRALAPFRALLAGNPEQRLTAVFLLGLMGHAAGAPAVELLADVVRRGPPALARQACTAIGHLGLPEGVAPLAALLQGPGDLSVQRKAVVALARLGGADVAPALRRLLAADRPAALRSVAAAALAELGGDEARAAPEWTPRRS